MGNQLRDHVRELRPQISPVPRRNDDLIRAHARWHHRMHSNHYHQPDNAGRLAGPNTDQRRPSGWYDGGGVIMREVR